MAKEEFNTELSLGKLTVYNCVLLGVTRSQLEHLCEGWGSKFCLDCPFQDAIPEDCEADCANCTRICPCNRSCDYEEIRKELMVSENARIHEGVLT